MRPASPFAPGRPLNIINWITSVSQLQVFKRNSSNYGIVMEDKVSGRDDIIRIMIHRSHLSGKDKHPYFSNLRPHESWHYKCDFAYCFARQSRISQISF